MADTGKASTPAGAPKAAPAEACALERLPHIIKKMCLLWPHKEFDSFSQHLMMDSRDGKRQGLPWDVAEEILFLFELRVTKRAIVASEATGQPFWEAYKHMLANAEAEAQALASAWNDPAYSANTGRSKGDAGFARGVPPKSDKPASPKKRSWLDKLLG
jgi:hypothetical protein